VVQSIEEVVAELIKTARREKGITQEELAELAHIDRAHMFRIESGKVSITLTTLESIAAALGVRPKDLVP
jgi:transcriptional regulator with XRE-family HTH domain